MQEMKKPGQKLAFDVKKNHLVDSIEKKNSGNYLDDNIISLKESLCPTQLKRRVDMSKISVSELEKNNENKTDPDYEIKK